MKNLFSIVILLSIFFCVNLSMYAQKEIKVSCPQKVHVGEIFRVSYFLETEDSEPDLRLVYNDDIYKVVEGPSYSNYATMSFVNGKLQNIKRLNVFAKICFEKEGEYNLPNLKIEDESGHYIEYPINQKILVSDNIDKETTELKDSILCKEGQLKDFLDVVATIDKKELALGDSFECEYRIYTDLDVTGTSNDSYKIYNSFWHETDSLSRTMDTEKYKGTNARSLLWAKLKITPLKAGKIVIPSMPFSAVYYVQDKSIDPIEAFFNGGAGVYCDTLVYSNSLTVEVKDRKISSEENIWENPETPKNADCIVVLDRSSSLFCKEDSLAESYYELENVFMQKVMEKMDPSKTDVVAFAGRPSFLDGMSLKETISVFKDSLDNDRSSAIYDGILASIIRNRLYEKGEKQRTILLLTDGTDNSSRISASTLVCFLQKYGVKLNVVAFASNQDSVYYKEKYFDGTSPYYVKIKNYQKFEDLKNMAETTGGVFVQVRNKRQLIEAYKRIQKTLAIGGKSQINESFEFSFNDVLINRLFQEIYEESTQPL